MATGRFIDDGDGRIVLGAEAGREQIAFGGLRGEFAEVQVGGIVAAGESHIEAIVGGHGALAARGRIFAIEEAGGLRFQHVVGSRLQVLEPVGAGRVGVGRSDLSSILLQDDLNVGDACFACILDSVIIQINIDEA